MSYVQKIIEGENNVTLHLTCPLCEGDISQEIDTKDDTEQITCHNCKNRYFAFPIVDKNGNDVNNKNIKLEEKINIQMNSVEKVHEITENNPSGTIQASYTPIQAIAAVFASTTGYLGIGIMTVTVKPFLDMMLFKILFYTLPLLLFIGIVGVVIGPVASVYTGYKAYEKEDIDCSFTEFIYHTSNIYHTEPN